MTAQPGTVHLVGAGPGDPGLITVRGQRILESADVVVYDRLVAPELLESAKPGAKRLSAGKAPGGRGPSQAQINAQIIEHARAGRSVCRLKGGDPFVFGRGAEEIAAVQAAGVPWDVVPGVTSAVAAPAAARIPLTHRDWASTATLVTGHEGEAKDGAPVDWAAVAGAGGTIVILMGIATLPTTCERLIAAGRPSSEPVAVIERATWPDERITMGTLADIADTAERVGARNPAVVVVGPVVRALRGDAA
ncbi:MAG: uroporphyrinogen-III C-methyltransferase [Chloroflexota bacterium]|nr:uroporphyrinogen-III C-methyltransferase [Chloroflexota bacterium]